MPRRKKQLLPREDDAHIFVKKELHHESSAEMESEEIAADEPVQPQKKSREKKSGKRAKQPLSENETPVHSKRNIDEQLAEIYGNSDGSIPDMKHFEVRKSRRLLTAVLILFLSFACLGAVAWFGFFVWQPGSGFVEDDVILSVSGSENIAIGQKVQFRIRYKNAGKTPLAKAVIQVHYPEGFVFEQASITPSQETNDQWSVGALNTDDGSYLDISGRMYGDIKSEHSIRVFMNYVPANFTSEFQKVAHTTVSLAESPVDIHVETPQELFQGVEVPIIIKIKKREDLELSDGKFIVQFNPNGIFTKTKSEPKSDEFNQYQWTFDSLEAEKTITLRGAFSVPQDVPPEFSVTVLGAPEQLGDKKFVLAEKKETISIASPEVSVQTIVNGSVNQLNVQPGEKMVVRIAVRNNGKVPLKNAKVRFQLDGPSANNQSIFDWAEIVDSNDGDTQKGEQISDTLRRGQIIWTSKHIGELANLQPGSDVAIDLEIPIKSGEQADLSKFAAFTGELKADIQYEAGGSVQTVSGSPVALLFQSDASFTSEHTIEDSRAVFSWIIKNSFHELKDIHIKTVFFGDITPDASVFSPPAGAATYDDKTKTLVWKIDSMPIVVDVLSFEFMTTIQKLNPSQTQLTSKIQFEAFDTVTGEKIIKVVEGVPVN